VSAALRLVELTRSTAPTLSPASLATARPSFRPSMRPTLVPSSRATVIPSLTGSFATVPPSTQRSATVHPRFEAVARHEVSNLVAVLRANVEFLASLLSGAPPAMAASALDDLHETIDRLERRFAVRG
jgi:hypothetical protein